MNNALGMNHDVDVVIIYAKQIVRFNHFQAFVHQGCGINGDFPAHGPVGMLERVGHGNIR